MTNASELIFVGIDVSKDTLEVALDDSAKTQTLSNDEAGVRALIAKLKPSRVREREQCAAPSPAKGHEGAPRGPGGGGG